MQIRSRSWLTSPRDRRPTPTPPAVPPLAQLRAGRLGRRLPQLVGGLLLYGWSMAMMVQAGLGLDPWDVLHEGLARHVPLSFGQVVIAVGAAVLVLWIPLRQVPGLGTVLNVVLIGLAADVGIAVIPHPDHVVAAAAMLVSGVVLNALAGALYIGTHLGPGPRDGVWLGIVRVTGCSVRVARTGVEVGVLAVGFLLGGTVGVGTVLYAVAIGPLVQLFLPWVSVGSPAPPRRPARP